MAQERSAVMGDATRTGPVVDNQGCSPGIDHGVRGIEGMLPERLDQRRRERGVAVVFIDALRRRPESDLV
jgi:hypothetical protein